MREWGRAAFFAVSFGLIIPNFIWADSISPAFFDNCHHLMQSVGDAKSGKVLISAKNLGKLKENIQLPGEKMTRRLELSLDGSLNAEFNLVFSWKSPDLQAEHYSMRVRPDRKILNRYWIEINFPKDESGEWKNTELLYDAFEHLHLRMREDVDEFIVDLHGRHLIDQLNSILNDTMVKFGAFRDPIRRVSSPEDVANWLEGVYYEFDYDRDSFLPVFEASEFSSLVMSMDEGNRLRLEWLARIRETSFMKVIESAGHWSRNIELQVVTTHSHRREALPLERAGEDGLVARYQLRLRPGF